MNIGRIYVCALSICASFAQSFAGHACHKANLALSTLTAARDEIRNEMAVVDSTLSRLPKAPNEAQTSSAIADVHSALENILIVVKNSTAVINSGADIEERQTANLDLDNIVFTITAVTQDVVTDVAKAVGAALNLFNDSSLIQELSGLLINSILALLTALGNLLRELPHIQDVLDVVAEIVKHIPL